jgi:hypothetical protein
MAGTDDVEQLIEARLRRIEEELEPAAALVAERERLQRALTALSERDGHAAPRAARGANLQTIVEFVAANPGRRAGDVAAATGIARPVVYSAVSRLVQAGRLRRETTPDGGVLYFPPAS